jgi:hypothetical protein
LVGVNDAMLMVLWTRLFLKGQGFIVKDNAIHQDNQGSILLETNGKMSTSKPTRHINIRYFFITNNVAKGQVRFEYCPTYDMIADFFTKPLQGLKFRYFRNVILGIKAEDPVVSCKECVETSATESKSCLILMQD